MRIAIDIRALMEGKTTGVEVYLINLLENLFKIDQNNEYVLWANSFRKIKLPEFRYPNVNTIVTGYPNKLFNLAQKLGFPKLDRLLGSFDLFFSPHWRATAVDAEIPLIVTFHDLVSEFAPQFFTFRRRIWHWFMNYRSAAGRANKIIAVSESTKRDLVDLYGIEEGKIEVIYPGVRPHPSPLLGKERELKAGEVEEYFLFFGTLEPRKNIEAVLAAYEIYFQKSQKKRPLVIAGSAGWKTRIEIPRAIEGKVQIQKNVSEQDRSQIYQNAFALVFPSFYEGFGFPVLEAASLGVPVITSYNSSLAEVGRDFALFINPFRPSQIAQVMLELENEGKLYSDLQQNGLDAVKQYDWQKAARQTLKVFESI